MAKTIVIPGTNFETNALDQVEFADVPCTGITLDADTMSFSQLDEQKTIGYTVAPYNTTDPVTVTSGNTNIITVNGDVLTAVGIGTCTVTVTCGEQSAACTVTSTISADFVAAAHARHTEGSTTYGTSVVNTGNAGYALLGRNNANSLQIGISPNGTAVEIGNLRLCPILIPKNTGTIRVTAPASGRFYWTFHNSKEATTSHDTPTAKETKAATYKYSSMVTGSSVDITFDSVAAIGELVVNNTGTDSIAITFYDSSNSQSVGELVSGFTVQFIPVSA